MILQSVMKRVLDQLPGLYDQLGVSLLHRDGAIEPFSHENPDAFVGFRVVVGNPNGEGQFSLTFSRDGSLEKVIKKTANGHEYLQKGFHLPILDKGLGGLP
jgi:hypothetical protein